MYRKKKEVIIFMGIILGLIILTVISLLAAYLLNTKTANDHFISEISCATIGVSACITLIICSILCAVLKINADLEYQNTLQQYEIIEYRLKENKSDTNLLISDITEYNNKIREYKKWKNNFWLNWFYPADIDELEYIELS